MRDLTKLTNEVLSDNTKDLVQHECETLTNILHHLREHERRRFYRGHKNLHEYAIKFLGYDNGQASRRISAMLLLQEFPSLEPAVKSGDLKLTHITFARSVFYNEKKKKRELTPEKKLEVLEAMSGLTTRGAERAALEFVPELPPKKDEIRALPNGRNSLSGEISDETLAKLEKLKGMQAHVNPNMSLDELLNQLADLGLEQWSKARDPKRKVKPNTKAAIRRAIWKRDKEQCTGCGSIYAVQEDHILPKGMGGEYTLENMRLLCRKCNQRAAIKVYGHTKMDKHFVARQSSKGRSARKAERKASQGWTG